MILVVLVPLVILLLAGFLLFRGAARAATRVIPVAPAPARLGPPLAARRCRPVADCDADAAKYAARGTLHHDGGGRGGDALGRSPRRPSPRRAPAELQRDGWHPRQDRRRGHHRAAHHGGPAPHEQRPVSPALRLGDDDDPRHLARLP